MDKYQSNNPAIIHKYHFLSSKMIILMKDCVTLLVWKYWNYVWTCRFLWKNITMLEIEKPNRYYLASKQVFWSCDGINPGLQTQI